MTGAVLGEEALGALTGLPVLPLQTLGAGHALRRVRAAFPGSQQGPALLPAPEVALQALALARQRALGVQHALALLGARPARGHH